MDNKNFEKRLAERFPIKKSLLESLIKETQSFIGKRLADSDSINIQGFGSFEITKQIEHIITQPESGKRLLMPPHLTINFNPSRSLLNKLKLRKNEQ
ncbi:MAG: HU family DNA-binding protein [Bacteroidales bacterium]